MDVRSQDAGVRRFFTKVASLPPEYDNKDTIIKMTTNTGVYGYSVVIVNPELPPLILDTEGVWKKLEPKEVNK